MALLFTLDISSRIVTEKQRGTIILTMPHMHYSPGALHHLSFFHSPGPLSKRKLIARLSKLMRCIVSTTIKRQQPSSRSASVQLSATKETPNSKSIWVLQPQDKPLLRMEGHPFSSCRSRWIKWLGICKTAA